MAPQKSACPQPLVPTSLPLDLNKGVKQAQLFRTGLALPVNDVPEMQVHSAFSAQSTAVVFCQ